MSSTSSPPAASTARPLVRLGVGWWAWAVLVLGGLVVFAAGGGILAGGLVMAAGFAVAAVLRAVLPADKAGGLHIRGRRIDVLLHGLMAVAVALAAVLVHLREAT